MNDYPLPEAAAEIDIPWETDYDNVVPEPASSPVFSGEGIVPLGHDRGVFYYLSRSAQQIFALPPDKHTKNMMLAMASLPHYWQQSRFTSDKGGIRWDEAIDNLMRSCRDIGIYDPDRIRGRGAWLDNGRPILHLGNRIICDGVEHSLNFPDSQFVYECAKPLSVTSAPPLSNQDAHWLIKICNLLRWEKPIYGKLLAGWIALAPICGALKWRPSIWITGGRGSGKSWIYENVIRAALGEIPLSVQATTTDAYIRQELGSDARPVIFDEAEQEDKQATLRMQAVLSLMRQSSSNNAPAIGKGSQQGKPIKYKIRSMFLFQSINIGIKHGADESRITALGLREATKADAADQAKFADLEATVAERITPEFSAGLIARSVKLIPVIRANAETFARAIASGLGSRRLGDQIGTLLAGAYSLHSTGLITLEQASQFVARDEWSDHTEADEDRDEFKLLGTLLSLRLRIGTNEMPVSRLLEAARLPEQRDGLPAPDLAQRAINECGIKFAHRENIPGVYISTNHPALRRALVDTPWSAGWSRALLRIQGSEPSGTAIRFGLGAQSKAAWIPMAVIDPVEKS